MAKIKRKFRVKKPAPRTLMVETTKEIGDWKSGKTPLWFRENTWFKKIGRTPGNQGKNQLCVHWAASQFTGGFELPFICWRDFQEPIKPCQREGNKKRGKGILIPAKRLQWGDGAGWAGAVSKGAFQAQEEDWLSWCEPVSWSMLLPIHHLVQTWVSATGLTREPGSNKTLTDKVGHSLLPVYRLPFETWSKGWGRTKRHWWLITT